MQVGKIISAIGNKFSFRPKQDLTSFGAINQNVSFDGFHKTVKVEEKGEEVVTSVKYLYGSSGSVWFERDEYQGEKSQGVDYIGKEEKTEWVVNKYTARIKGSKKQFSDNSSQRDAIQGAIRGYRSYEAGSEIIELRRPYMHDHSTEADVYFSDPYEIISRSVIDDSSVNYVVKAPNASIQAPPKKSFWQRLFG